MGKLTATIIKALAAAGRYGDGGTLFLSIAPGGSKSWVQRVTIDGHRRDIGLGGWPVVSLAKARQRAFANRVAIADGLDPLAEKRKTRTPTFRHAAEQTFEANKPRWRNPKVESNWMQQLERHAFARLGDIPVNQIGREDVLAVLTPIWTTKPETARRVRRTIKATLRWCQAHGFVEHNAAGEAIAGALPAMAAVKQHFRALPYAEVPEALQVVEGSRASPAGEALPSVPDPDGRPERRGAGRDLDRDRHRGPGVAHPRRPDEGRCGAPPAAERRGDGRARTGAGTRRRQRPDLSVPNAAREAAVGYGADEALAGQRARRADDGPRLPLGLQGLGRRAH